MSIAAVAVVLLGVIGFAVIGHPTTQATVGSEQPMAAAVVHAATAVPAAAFDAVGVTSSVPVRPPVALPAATPAITVGGKPLVLYVGGEFCPYCAAERWALVTALARFGTFSHLGATKSSSVDVAASTNTFDFYQSSYTSPYVAFQPVEIYSNTPAASGTGYTTLETLTPAQRSLVTTYAGGTPGAAPGIPFVLVANQLTISGASYDPNLLAGLTWSQIGSGLRDPTNPITQAILATANYLSAGICAANGQQPATVCSSPGVRAAAGALHHS